MRRATPRNAFTDALNLSGLSFAEASELLDKSPASIQSYALGTRNPPPELLDRLSAHGFDAMVTDGECDRYGSSFLDGALSLRRAARHSLVRGDFDALRELQHRNIQPDPDAGPGVGPDPDFEHDDGDDR